MALTLAQRLTAAKKPHARLADNEKLLADLRAERDRLTAARDQAAGQSIDFALSDTDRDEAAAKASRCDRTITGLEAEIAALATLIEERRDEETAAKVEAERAEVRAERDALAAEFAETVPAAVATLTDLFARVKANFERLIAIGDRNGCAEAQARGLPAFTGTGFDNAQFLKMKIPSFHGGERAWPPVTRIPVYDYAGQVARQKAAAAKQEADKREAAEKFARENGAYSLGTSLANYGRVSLPSEIVKANKSLPYVVVGLDSWQGTIPHTVAEELRKVDNLIVDLIPARKR